jgi:hypothetical protein
LKKSQIQSQWHNRLYLLHKPDRNIRLDQVDAFQKVQLERSNGYRDQVAIGILVGDREDVIKADFSIVRPESSLKVMEAKCFRHGLFLDGYVRSVIPRIWISHAE